MLLFSSFLRIFVAAPTREQRQRWTQVFETLAGNSNRSIRAGSWVEDDKVSFEPNLVFEVWGPGYDLVTRLLAAAKEMQADCRQEGISLVAQGRGGWQAMVVMAERQKDGSVLVSDKEWADALFHVCYRLDVHAPITPTELTPEEREEQDREDLYWEQEFWSEEDWAEYFKEHPEEA